MNGQRNVRESVPVHLVSLDTLDHMGHQCHHINLHGSLQDVKTEVFSNINSSLPRAAP